MTIKHHNKLLTACSLPSVNNRWKNHNKILSITQKFLKKLLIKVNLLETFMILTLNKMDNKIILNIKHKKIMKCTVWWMKVQLNKLMIFLWSQDLFFHNNMRISKLKDSIIQRRRKEKDHNLRNKKLWNKWWHHLRVRRCQKRKERGTMFKQYHLFDW